MHCSFEALAYRAIIARGEHIYHYDKFLFRARPLDILDA